MGQVTAPKRRKQLHGVELGMHCLYLGVVAVEAHARYYPLVAGGLVVVMVARAALARDDQE